MRSSEVGHALLVVAALAAAKNSTGYSHMKAFTIFLQAFRLFALAAFSHLAQLHS